MRRIIVAIVACAAFAGTLVAGCDTEQAGQKPASEQTPAKKAPRGC